MLYANVALATAWAFFSGTTRYISLATAAFFGVGIYALAIAHVYVPVAMALVAAATMGFLVALVVGLSTLRLRGVYFVVFTFGLTELMHQVLNWWEININKSVTRYIFTDVSNVSIYRTLLAVALDHDRGQLVREPDPARLCPARHRRGRDGGPPHRHQHHARQDRVLCALGLGNGAGRRGAGLALPLYRRQHRLQQQLVLPGA